MAGRTNADNVQRFKADLARFQPLLRGRVDLLLRRVAMIVAQNIIVGGTYGPGTPVDTGFARASWFVSMGAGGRSSAAPSKPRDPKKAKGALGDGEGALAMAIAMFAGITSGGPTIYLLNDAVYIRSLEYGHSKQAPAGMVRVVLGSLQTIVSDAVHEIAGGGRAGGMSATFDADVRRALRGGVATGCAGLIDTTNQWAIEARDFIPTIGVPYVRDTLMWGQERLRTIPSQKGLTRLDALYLIDVFFRDGDGSATADQCAAQMRTAFAAGTTLSSNGQLLYLNGFKRSRGLVADRFLMTPLAVSFYTYNTNP